MKEANGGALVEVGSNGKRGWQLPEHETDWEDIVKMVESMRLILVPKEKITKEDEVSKSASKNRGKWELWTISKNRNLGGEPSIPNEDHDMECKRVWVLP